MRRRPPTQTEHRNILHRNFLGIPNFHSATTYGTISCSLLHVLFFYVFRSLCLLKLPRNLL